jgi:transcriptional regulator with XRE-family HTH domain
MDMDDRGEIGPRVRAARQRLGWNREALAFHAGLSWSAIAQVETGRRTNLRPATLIALSHALGVTVDYLADGSTSTRPTMLDHSAFSYGTDDQIRTSIGSYLAEGIVRSEAMLAVTTPVNIELLREYLGKDARGVEFADASTWYRTPSAALQAYRSFADAKLDRGAHWLRVVGEPVWTGRAGADVQLWTRYESLFNLVFRACPLTVVCLYDERTLTPEIVEHARLTHPHIMDDHGTRESPDYADPEQFVLER